MWSRIQMTMQRRGYTQTYDVMNNVSHFLMTNCMKFSSSSFVFSQARGFPGITGKVAGYCVWQVHRQNVELLTKKWMTVWGGSRQIKHFLLAFALTSSRMCGNVTHWTADFMVQNRALPRNGWLDFGKGCTYKISRTLFFLQLVQLLTKLLLKGEICLVLMWP